MILLAPWTTALTDFGSSPATLIDWLDELGYEIAVYDADRNMLEYPAGALARRRKLLAIARSERNFVLRRLADTTAADHRPLTEYRPSPCPPRFAVERTRQCRGSIGPSTERRSG